MSSATITKDGTLEVPKEIIENRHWLPGTKIEFLSVGGEIKMVPPKCEEPKFDPEKFEAARKRLEGVNWDLTRQVIDENRSEC